MRVTTGELGALFKSFWEEWNTSEKDVACKLITTPGTRPQLSEFVVALMYFSRQPRPAQARQKHCSCIMLGQIANVANFSVDSLSATPSTATGLMEKASRFLGSGGQKRKFREADVYAYAVQQAVHVEKRYRTSGAFQRGSGEVCTGSMTDRVDCLRYLIKGRRVCSQVETKIFQIVFDGSLVGTQKAELHYAGML